MMTIFEDIDGDLHEIYLLQDDQKILLTSLEFEDPRSCIEVMCSLVGVSVEYFRGEASGHSFIWKFPSGPEKPPPSRSANGANDANTSNGASGTNTSNGANDSDTSTYQRDDLLNDANGASSTNTSNDTNFTCSYDANDTNATNGCQQANLNNKQESSTAAASILLLFSKWTIILQNISDAHIRHLSEYNTLLDPTTGEISSVFLTPSSWVILEAFAQLKTQFQTFALQTFIDPQKVDRYLQRESTPALLKLGIAFEIHNEHTPNRF